MVKNLDKNEPKSKIEKEIPEEKIRKQAYEIYEKRLRGEPGYEYEKIDEILKKAGITPGTPEAEKFMREWDWAEAEKLLKEKKKKDYEKWKEYFGPLAEIEEEKERLEKEKDLEKRERELKEKEEELKKQMEALEKEKKELEKARKELEEIYKKTEKVTSKEDEMKEYIEQNLQERLKEKEKKWQEEVSKARTSTGEALTEAEKRSLMRNLYLAELPGYSIKYEGGIKGALRGFFTGKEKAKILKDGKPIEKDGKPLDFKVNWYWKHPEKDMVDFLKNEIEKKLRDELEKEWKENKEKKQE